MSKKGSKNNASNRGKAVELKEFDGKKVKPILYNGAQVGHGSYIAARFEDGKLAKDDNGKPVAYKLV